MKFLIVASIVALTFAEPPRFRPARFRLQRQELAPSTTESQAESTTEIPDAPYPAAGGPYPPSGWKPDGQAFTLPQKTAEPVDSYGAPQQSGPYPPSGWKPAGEQLTLPSEQQVSPAASYGAPDNTYGPPDNTYGPPSTDSSNVEPVTDNPQAEKLDGPVEIQKSAGTYFILLPNGELQRVEFMTENDVQNMAYTARLRLQERAPLFIFRA